MYSSEASTWGAAAGRTTATTAPALLCERRMPDWAPEQGPEGRVATLEWGCGQICGTASALAPFLFGYIVAVGRKCVDSHVSHQST